MAYQLAAADSTNDIALIRQDMRSPTNCLWGPSRTAQDVMQAYHFLLILDEQQRAAGYLIFPRDPAVARKTGGFFSWDGNDESVAWETIQGRLRKYGDRLEPL